MSVVSSNQPGRASYWHAIYAGVALTTMATLLLELSLTRIFSVVFYYHFAFLAISIALFGLGAGGVLSYFLGARGGPAFRRLGYLAFANALAVFVSLVVILGRTATDGTAALALTYCAAALPFLIAGTIVSTIIAETIERVGRVYFFDLLGAAGGCLLLIPFLNILGGPGTVLTAAVLFAASSAVWFWLASSVRGRTLGVALALALVIFLIYNPRAHWVDVRTAKGKLLGEEVWVKWNSFSRIAVTEDKASQRRTVVIDGDATTGIANFDFAHLSEDQKRELTQMGPSLPHAIRPGAKTLVIGSGGGWDVSRALVAGSRDVTGVEINPIIADTIMRKRFPQWSNRLYFRPEVRIFVEDGRSFVRRSREKYGIIQATLVDTWASTAAGAFALSENNLYTTDAFEDYLRHLDETGVLSFTRWGFDPPRESLRLISLAVEALARMGIGEPASHFVVVREGGRRALEGFGALDTVLISRAGFTAADLDVVCKLSAEAGFGIVYLPGQKTDNVFGELLNAKDRAAFFRSYQYDVSPVGDDRPFFFYTVQPRDVWNFARTAASGTADFKVNLAVPTLFRLVGLSLGATLVILLLPPLILRSRLPRERGVGTFLVYFLCLGAGYILIQVGLIQKLVLFLGHPTYALTVVIFSMLVATGFGSYFSRRIVGTDDGRLSLALLVVAALVVILALMIAPVTTALAGWPLLAKMLLTVAMITPAAFAMGIPFPSGLARLEAWHKPSVRWAWSLNAAASVLGSAGAMLLAIYAGLFVTLLCGAALYGVALVSLRLSWRVRASTG